MSNESATEAARIVCEIASSAHAIRCECGPAQDPRCHEIQETAGRARRLLLNTLYGEFVQSKLRTSSAVSL